MTIPVTCVPWPFWSSAEFALSLKQGSLLPEVKNTWLTKDFPANAG